MRSSTIGTSHKGRVSMILLAIVIVTILIVASMDLGEPRELVLATTTSTYDSGLLDHILADYESSHDVRVKVVAVGSGQALRLGLDGDADVLLVHSPSEEVRFVEQGYGLFRQPVMYNEFVIVGPMSDPAGVADHENVADALNDIERSRQTFCSRGDDSGTHARERSMWVEAGFDYDDLTSRGNSEWYLSLGQGMGDTLRMASDLGGYTLTDAGTFFSIEGELDLVILLSDADELQNQYSVIPVNGSNHPSVNQEMAVEFASWMMSSSTQSMIDAYTRDGKSLFTANAMEV
jgi:tungstate transport system substrate-binding protein